MANSAGEKAARALRSSIGNQTEPFVNLRDFLRSRNDIVLVERPMTANLDGAYAHDDRVHKGFIYINAKPIWTRRRFTMAHELGHHLLEHRERSDRNVFEYDLRDTAEVEANAFAAELLMPAAGICAAPRVNESSDAAELAAYYLVSGQAIIYRLHSLGLIDKKLKQVLLDAYDPRFYASFIETDSTDRLETARTTFPDHYTDAIIRLYRDGEISREAAEEALDITSNEAADVLPAIAG
jgi:Zn-dependent peptidase ImmA (M78 family)